MLTVLFSSGLRHSEQVRKVSFGQRTRYKMSTCLGWAFWLGYKTSSFILPKHKLTIYSMYILGMYNFFITTELIPNGDNFI